MKAGPEHRVPLSPRALGVLREAAALRRGGLVFPAPSTGRALPVAALGEVLRAARVDAVPHGFRSTDLFDRRRTLMAYWAAYVA